MKQLGWRLLAAVFVALGLVGAVLPVMPTTVFLLLGAWAAGHGWPGLHDWLLGHPRYGPVIVQWRSHGIVPRRAKWLATGSILVSIVILCVGTDVACLKWSIPPLLGLLLIWLWRRPEKPA